jgi:hypothetical protein
MPTEVPAGTVEFVDNVVEAIINPIIGVIFVVAFVYFLWGLMVFILSAGDSTKVTEGKQHMLWGVVGMTIMVSVFAIIAIGLATFGIGGTDLPDQIESVR